MDAPMKKKKRRTDVCSPLFTNSTASLGDVSTFTYLFMSTYKGIRVRNGSTLPASKLA